MIPEEHNVPYTSSRGPSPGSFSVYWNFNVGDGTGSGYGNEDGESNVYLYSAHCSDDGMQSPDHYFWAPDGCGDGQGHGA